MGRRLRKYSHFCGDSITLPDFFANRFRDNKGIIRVIASIFILAFFLFYTVSGFVASAKLFGTIFGMNYTTGLIIGAVVVVSYTFMGGFFAVCWTDFIQATMMLIAVIAIPSIIMTGSGGFAATMDAVNAQNPYLMSLFTNATTGKSIGLIALISSLAWGLGYFGMPHILVRFMSIKNAEDIKFSRRVAMTWVSICLGAAIMIAIGFILMMIAFFFSLKIEQIAGYYQCANCGHKYVPTFKAVFLAMHMGRTRHLRCPKCGEKSWQKKVL